MLIFSRPAFNILSDFTFHVNIYCRYLELGIDKTLAKTTNLAARVNQFTFELFIVNDVMGFFSGRVSLYQINDVDKILRSA